MFFHFLSLQFGPCVGRRVLFSGIENKVSIVDQQPTARETRYASNAYLKRPCPAFLYQGAEGSVFPTLGRPALRPA